MSRRRSARTTGGFVHMLISLVFVFHIAGGTVGLVSGVVAASAAKGGALHRAAGRTFVLAMLVMGLFGLVLSVVRPGQIPNLFISLFALYLVATAWLTVRPAGRRRWLADRVALVVILLLCAPFAILSFQLAVGATPLVKSATPLVGPVRIAIFVFTAVTLLAAASDVRVLLARGIAGVRRIERHLWRMCLGLALAAGSAFTNGLPRLLPRDLHVPFGLFFIPQFAALGLLVFWMARVKLTSWRPRASAA